MHFSLVLLASVASAPNPSAPVKNMANRAPSDATVHATAKLQPKLSAVRPIDVPNAPLQKRLPSHADGADKKKLGPLFNDENE